MHRRAQQLSEWIKRGVRCDVCHRPLFHQWMWETAPGAIQQKTEWGRDPENNRICWPCEVDAGTIKRGAIYGQDAPGAPFVVGTNVWLGKGRTSGQHAKTGMWQRYRHNPVDYHNYYRRRNPITFDPDRSDLFRRPRN